MGNYIWPNYYIFETYEEEINYLKSWISNRLSWMDSEILLLGLENHPVISSFTLDQAYPNPFNPITNIGYELPKESFVNITIYDILGNEIKNLVDQIENPGSKLIQWNATNNAGQSVSAGVYLYSIEAGQFMQTKKMILIK